jgi:hypothetical protein
MTITRKEQLDQLWDLILKELITRIKEGKASSADLANAIRFIKEGDIDSLKDTLPNAEFLKDLEDIDFQELN